MILVYPDCLLLLFKKMTQRIKHLFFRTDAREKRGDLTQSCDKIPYTHRKVQKAL